MTKIDKKRFEEFHENEKEFCRKSGPLNSKKIAAPSAVAKALIMSLVTAATVYTVGFTEIFSFVPSLVNVIENSAIIETQIENIPEDSKIIYELFSSDELDKVILLGDINDESNQIRLEGLDYNTEYIVKFYLQSKGKKELIDNINFKVNDLLDDSDVPEAPDEPEVPEIPDIPENPEVPDVPVVPNLPEVPNIPEEPNTPEVPDNEETPIEILVGDSRVNHVSTYNQNQGYIINETHVFTQVLSDAYTINVTQNNEEVTYEATYDKETETLTVTFDGNPVTYGETSNSKVVVTYEDVSVESTNTITTPKLNGITLDVVYNEDGTYTYQMEVNGTEPSMGTVETNIVLNPDLYEVFGDIEIQTYNIDGVTFSEEYTRVIDAYGQTLTGMAYAEMVWSLDETVSPQRAETTVDYRVPNISRLSFDDVYESGPGYMYTVNVEFANLVNAIPQSIEFYRQQYDPIYNEIMGEELVMTLDDSQILIDEYSNISASYTVPEDEVLPFEAAGHKYRVVLTYLDSFNEIRTIEIIDHIEPLRPVFNHLNSVMWQEDGITYADYEMVFSISDTYSPKGATMLSLNALYWDVLSAELEMTDTHGYVRGQMSTERNYELSLNVYLDWLHTVEEDYIYTGCGGASYIESSLTNQIIVPNSTNSGYDSVTEEFTFVEGSNLLSEYTNEYVLVTLADGSQIKVTETELDPTGLVSVNWNDNDNIVVTVSQTDVSLGQLTTVDFVIESVREEDMMYGLVNSYVYRYMSKY